SDLAECLSPRVSHYRTDPTRGENPTVLALDSCLGHYGSCLGHPTRSGLRDGSQPTPVVGLSPPDDVVVPALQRRRDRTSLSVSDRDGVQRRDGGDFQSGTGEKCLVTDVELAPVDGALYDLELELLGEQRHGCFPGDPLEDSADRVRRDDLAISAEENARSRPLRHLATRAEHDQGIESAGLRVGISESPAVVVG